MTLEERIKIRAYEIWQWREDNLIEGTAEQDWLEAEKELTEWMNDLKVQREFQ